MKKAVAVLILLVHVVLSQQHFEEGHVIDAEGQA